MSIGQRRSKRETKILCDEIKKRYSILDFVRSKGIKIHDRGHRSFIVCPFHRDNDPSLNIEEHNGIELFYCFGCKKKGTIIDFYAFYNNIDIGQAIEELGKGIDLDFDISELLDEFDEKEKKVSILELNVALSIHCFEYMCQVRDSYGDEITQREFKKVDALYRKIDEFVEANNVDKVKAYYDEICVGDFFTERLKQLEDEHADKCDS